MKETAAREEAEKKFEAKWQAKETLLSEKTSLKLTLEDERHDKEILQNYLVTAQRELKDVVTREKKNEDLINKLWGRIRTIADFKK